jgi:uncharacterized protein YutE (UPF0331/DUF86 family)
VAWSAVEKEILATVKRLAISDDDPRKGIDLLVEEMAISPMTMDILRRMKNLRNIAVHRHTEEVTTDDAREFIALARGVIKKLQTLPSA